MDVGDCEGKSVGDDDGDVEGKLVGASVGSFVSKQQSTRIYPKKL